MAGRKAVCRVHQHDEPDAVGLDFGCGRAQEVANDDGTAMAHPDLFGHSIGQPRAEEHRFQETRLVLHRPAVIGAGLGVRREGGMLAPGGCDPLGEPGRGHDANPMAAGRQLATEPAGGLVAPPPCQVTMTTPPMSYAFPMM
jgi:hypothetical protein